MKLSVFIIAASFLASTTGKPHDETAENTQPSYKHIVNTGVFGETYNFAKKEQGNTNTTMSDHSKYEVYEPEEYGKGSTEEHVFGGGRKDGYDGYSKGNQYYGHYGSDAQREHAEEEYEHDEHREVAYGKHSKGTYDHVESGYKKEGGDIYGYNHESKGHHNSEEKYGYHAGGRKEENTGTGYYVTEKHNENKVSTNVAQYNEHAEDKRDVIEGSRGLGDFATSMDKEPKIQAKESTDERYVGTIEIQNKDSRNGAHETMGQKGASGGLGDYASGKHEEFRYRSDSGNEHGKYGSAVEEEHTNDERYLKGGKKGYEVKELEEHYR